MGNIDYNTLIKEVRHRYELKYGKKLDDEILYIIIRINEMEVSVKKLIEASKQKDIKPTLIQKTVEKSNQKSIYILLSIVMFMQIIILIKGLR